MTNTTALADTGYISISECNGMSVRFLPVAPGSLKPRMAALALADSLFDRDGLFLDSDVVAVVACEHWTHGYGVKITFFVGE